MRVQRRGAHASRCEDVRLAIAAGGRDAGRRRRTSRRRRQRRDFGPRRHPAPIPWRRVCSVLGSSAVVVVVVFVPVALGIAALLRIALSVLS